MRSTLLLLMLCLANASYTQSIQFQQAVTGFSSPVDIAHCGDERLFVVERPGRIRIVRNGAINPVPFLDITGIVNDGGGEQGLLGLAFHPQYAANGWFYVFYVGGTGNGFTAVARYNVSGNPDVADPNSALVMWSLAQPYANHNGGDIDFGPDGKLYFSTGDGGDGGDPGNRAQDLGLHFGKILRVTPTSGGYSIPANNPFVGQQGALPEIWAYGLRNPWRFGFDRQTGDLWIGDVGQGAWEEVDKWPVGNNSGPNFGWRCYEGGAAYNTAGCQPQSSYVGPVAVGAHGSSQGPNGGEWCSVIGGRVYRGNKYPALAGKYVYTDYCHGRIHWIDAADPSSQGTFTGSGIYGFSAIAEDRCGELWAVNVNNGRLYRIVDTDVCPEDVNRDGIVKYTGTNNDRDPVLIAVGATSPNNPAPCACCLADVTGDGVVKYTGNGNDRDPIILGVGSTSPNNTVACPDGQ